MTDAPELSPIRFDGRVAIVTGAGGGLGRAYALALAARGAKVIVNDRGGGAPSPAAERVAAEITASGGVALADPADVTVVEQVQAMVERALSHWGRVDILINNAGILRDKSFAKMDLADFHRIIDVHLMGSANCSKAVWAAMRAQAYGRIVFTASSSGLYGNFGQANYGAAKAAMVGLMNVLDIEGAKSGIRVNVIAPTAATAMTEGLISAEASALLSPEAVAPAVLYLVSEQAPSRTILGAGAGVYAAVHVLESEGVYLAPHERTPEGIARRAREIADPLTAKPLGNAFAQTAKYVAMAQAAQRAG